MRQPHRVRVREHPRCGDLRRAHAERAVQIGERRVAQRGVGRLGQAVGLRLDGSVQRAAGVGGAPVVVQQAPRRQRGRAQVPVLLAPAAVVPENSGARPWCPTRAGGSRGRPRSAVTSAATCPSPRCSRRAVQACQASARPSPPGCRRERLHSDRLAAARTRPAPSAASTARARSGRAEVRPVRASVLQRSQRAVAAAEARTAQRVSGATTSQQAGTVRPTMSPWKP